MILLFAGCITTTTPQTPVIPTQQRFCLNVSQTMPVTEEVYSVIHEGKSPRQAVETLLERDVKPETS